MELQGCYIVSFQSYLPPPVQLYGRKSKEVFG